MTNFDYLKEETEVFNICRCSNFSRKNNFNGPAGKCCQQPPGNGICN